MALTTPKRPCSGRLSDTLFSSVRRWLQTGRPRPAPIRCEAHLQAAIDAVWLDVPARGGWALSVTEPDGRCWLTGSGPLRDGEPELDFRYYDAWSRIPVSSVVPAQTGRPALLEPAATGRRPQSVPTRAL